MLMQIMPENSYANINVGNVIQMGCMVFRFL